MSFGERDWRCSTYIRAGVVAQDVTVLMNVLRRRNVEHLCKKGNPTIGEVRKKKEIWDKQVLLCIHDFAPPIIIPLSSTSGYGGSPIKIRTTFSQTTEHVYHAFRVIKNQPVALTI
jgi:hypothetical protein